VAEAGARIFISCNDGFVWPGFIGISGQGWKQTLSIKPDIQSGPAVVNIGANTELQA
jgi:hypothetical protein